MVPRISGRVLFGGHLTRGVRLVKGECSPIQPGVVTPASLNEETLRFLPQIIGPLKRTLYLIPGSPHGVLFIAVWPG